MCVFVSVCSSADVSVDLCIYTNVVCLCVFFSVAGLISKC